MSTTVSKARPGIGGKRPTPRRSIGSRGVRVFLGRILILVVFVGLWQAGYSAGIVSNIVARSPKQVYDAFMDLWSSGEMATNLWSTLSATVVAFLLASVVGIVVGVLLGMFPRVDQLLDPYVDALNSMPRIAFAPIFILAFGIGQTAKIALASTLVVFILLMNARSGVKSVDADILQLATVQNASRRQMLWKIVLPSSVPAIFAGLRLGLIYGLLGVVASEMIAARDGLGQLITKSSAVFELEYVYATVLMLALIAAVISRSMAAFENYLLRWQRR